MAIEKNLYHQTSEIKYEYILFVRYTYRVFLRILNFIKSIFQLGN